MSLKGKYSPLNLNALSSFVQNKGLTINPTTKTNVGRYTGSDVANGSYVTGSVTTGVLASLPAIFEKAFDLTYPVIHASDMIKGNTYIIKSVGTVIPTDFTICNSKSNKPGTEFIANGPGLGNGTVYDESDMSVIHVATYNRLVSMGAGVCEFLGNSAPNTYGRIVPRIETRYGFLAQYAIQAYKEFYINNGSYSDFFNTFNTCNSSRDQHNKVISSLVAGQTYLDGTYSNMNDLVSSDITGVNVSTFYWGQDLIASGRVIDLATIDKFGQPDNLLRTLNANKAVTKALNLALISVGFTATDITGLSNGIPATNDQQKSLYAAFNLILGNDLNDVLIPVNCSTQGLNTLADLLDPKKLFPSSFQSLTYPKYNPITLPTNSKTYFLLYKDGGANIDPTLNLGNTLSNFLPNDLAFVCDGFSKAMMQIKNVKTMNIEKFSQVVTNLENVNGLNVNGTSVPTDTTVTSAALPILANGSGANGQYLTKDFFGCMTDFYPFDKLVQAIHGLSSIDMSALSTIYSNMLTLLDSISPSDSTLNALITSANTEIQTLYNSNQGVIDTAFSIYKDLAKSLTIEQNARDMALPSGTDTLTTTVQETYGFIDNLNTYAMDTDKYQSENTLESISDTNDIGGNSLIGSMRELRNANRLNLIGGELDNDVGAPQLILPAKNGSLANINVLTSNGTTTPTTVVVNTGGTTTPGSTGGSTVTTLVPSGLTVINLNNTVNTPIIAPNTAINDVITCNCDCWELLKQT